MMRCWRLIILLLLAAVPRPVGAEESMPEVPVTLEADTLEYDWTTQLYRAEGGVTVTRGETRLHTDSLQGQALTRDVQASGAVQLNDGAGELHGEQLHVNLGTQRGLVSNGSVLLHARNFHLAGREIERYGESSYRVTDGRFTTCDGATPDWEFTAGQVDLTWGRYAVARDVWFKIRDLPLFYLPYVAFPTLADRESGLLLPRFGHSSRKGTLLSLAWYQVIDRHLDATLYLDYMSELGVGKGVEYRYAMAGDGGGEAHVYHVTGIGDHDDTFALKWQHNGPLGGGVRLNADVEYVEDIEFFEDFGDTSAEYTRDYTVSRIRLERNWDNLILTLLGEYVRDLDKDNDATLQRLPELSLGMPLHRLGTTPLYLQFDNLITNFVRDEGVDGQRFYSRPELNLVLKPGSWLELVPRVALHGRYYVINDTDPGVAEDDYDDDSLVAEYGLTASTRLARVFPVAFGGFDRLRHSIEPELDYTYIPASDENRLPSFTVDTYNRIGPVNRISYALVNRLVGRAVDGDGKRSYRELLNLRLSQSYDVAVARDDDLHDPEPFSALRAELRINPTATGALNLDAWMPVHGDSRFSKMTAGAGYDDQRGNRVALGYSYVRGDDGFSEPTDYLRVEGATAYLAPVYVDLLGRYDFREHQTLESLVNLEYRSQCWSLFLTWRQRQSLDGERDDTEVMLGFALSGLGRVGGYGGRSTP